MKKLFTLLAFLAVVMGAKAEWVEDYNIDYSTKENFPFYVMGYVPEWVDGVMTDFGANYRYATQADLDGDGDAKWKDGESSVGTAMAGTTEYQKVTGAGPYWHQYIVAADVPMELDGNYIVKVVVKASETVNANLQFGNWGSLKETGVTIPASEDFQEVEWEVSGCLFAGKGFICIQPGSSTATIEWKSLIVSHNQKAQRPTTWQEWLTSDGQPVIVETTSAAIPTYMGNAETPWGDLANVKFNDQENNYLICAWGKEKGVNLNENEGWDPFPATIEAEEGNESNHVFVVHGQPATTDGDPSAWDNQFWIQSPKNWKEGEQVKIHFRYRANRDGVKTNTQVHKQNPSDYKHWAAIGDITFNTTWQEFDQVVSWPNGAGDEGWSIAFNLNPEVKDAVDFYFDDLSWCSMKLDEGYFVAGSNPDTGLEYDFDNAIEFKEDGDMGGAPLFTATIGEKNAYVNQIMISTVRGNDASFKSNTLKPKNAIKNDPDDWNDYEPASLAKLNLPGSGIWKIYLVPEYSSMAFEMLEGEVKEAIDVVTNQTEIIVKGVERDDLSDTFNNETGERTGREEEGGTGEAWDNQFWFKANRTLAKGEVTHLKFSYKANKEAKTSTQCHGNPGAYMHWGAINDVNFTTDWQEFDQDFTVPAEADGMQTIAFNMAEIKEACDYEIKDVQWYLKDESLDEGKTWENLINATGTDNFWVKISAGTDPYQYEDATGISNIAAEKNAGSAMIFNLAGQRVDNGYKGIVVKSGKKVMMK